MAEWDAETQKAMVAYKTKVITEEQIHQLIANVGHDTEKIKATDEAYANLHGCCKYREGWESCSGGDDQKTTFLARNNQAFETHFHLICFVLGLSMQDVRHNSVCLRVRS